MPTKSQKHPYEPSLGVKTDFQILLQRFASAGTVRYEKFAECWREMNMACYCAGRQTKREAREFVEQCFQIATQFWLPPSSFLVRSGALYLLYGLYYFQLVIPKVKIRVTPEQWSTITEFQEEAREQQHLDLDYVFQKMVLDKAFQYVATPEEIIQSQRGSEDTKIIPESMKEDTCMLDDIFSSSALNQLSLVHDQYEKMKLALCGDDSSEPDTTLSIVHTDLVSSINKTLQTHKERQTGIIKSHASKDVTMESVEKEKLQVYTPLETLSKQKRLKQKAFEQGTGGYRQRGRPPDLGSDEAGNVEVEDQSEDDSAAIKRGRRKRHIQTLYDKDETEDAPVQIPEVHELFCMPDLDTIVTKPRLKKDCGRGVTDNGSEEKELVSETAQERKESDEDETFHESERLNQPEAENSNADVKEKEESYTSSKGRKTKPKRKSDTVEKSDTKKSKSEEQKNKEMSNSSKKKSNTESDQKISDDKKSMAKPNSRKETNEESEESTLEDKIQELKTRLERSEVKERKGEKELTAQEQLQMKLTQRKKEARLKSKKDNKQKRK